MKQSSITALVSFAGFRLLLDAVDARCCVHVHACRAALRLEDRGRRGRDYNACSKAVEIRTSVSHVKEGKCKKRKNYRMAVCLLKYITPREIT